jgi:hypothetical protein
MAEPESDMDYPVLVTERNGGYELRIRELLLVVRGPDLEQAYEELIKRKQEVIDSARAVGALDELPAPDRPPLVDAGAIRAHGLSGDIRNLLRTLAKRYF